MFEKLAETIQRLGYCTGLGHGYLFPGGTIVRPGEPDPDPDDSSGVEDEGA